MQSQSVVGSPTTEALRMEGLRERYDREWEHAEVLLWRRFIDPDPVEAATELHA